MSGSCAPVYDLPLPLVLQEALRILWAVPLVSRLVYTVAHVLQYQDGLLNYNMSHNFQLCHLPRSDKKTTQLNVLPRTTGLICARRYDLATALSDTERVLRWATVDACAKPCYKKLHCGNAQLQSIRRRLCHLCNGWWLCVQSRRLAETWLVLSSRMTPTLLIPNCSPH